MDRATRKPSAHTLKAYRHDFTAVADLLTAGRPSDIALTDITKDSLRAAFAAYASTYEPYDTSAAVRLCANAIRRADNSDALTLLPDLCIPGVALFSDPGQAENTWSLLAALNTTRPIRFSAVVLGWYTVQTSL